MQRCAFQQEKNLAVDGDVGPKTWAALIVTVRSGSRGDAVRGVQEEFQFRAGEPGQGLQVDGIFGPKTDAAVRGFQQALSLGADGIVGPKTWQALVSGMLAGGRQLTIGSRFRRCHWIIPPSSLFAPGSRPSTSGSTGPTTR